MDGEEGVGRSICLVESHKRPRPRGSPGRDRERALTTTVAERTGSGSEVHARLPREASPAPPPHNYANTTNDASTNSIQRVTSSQDPHDERAGKMRLDDTVLRYQRRHPLRRRWCRPCPDAWMEAVGESAERSAQPAEKQGASRPPQTQGSAHWAAAMESRTTW